MTKTHPGVDKIELFTPDFEVMDAFSRQFAIDETIRQGETRDHIPYLFTDKKGNEVRAHKIYHNSKLTGANYTMSRMGKDGHLSLSFRWNPSKMNHPYFLADIESEAITKSIQRMEAELSAIGIKANLYDAKLSRVDLAKQAQMRQNIYEYEPVFRTLEGRRLKSKIYETAYSFANKSTECVFYDKIAEMKAHKLDANLQGEKNLMRCEVKAKKTESIGSVLNISTLNDLLQMSNDAANHVYVRYLERKIFSKWHKPEQLLIPFDDQVEILKFYRERNKKAGWRDFLMVMQNTNEYIESIGGVEKFRQLLESAGYNRQNTYRIESIVIKRMKEAAALKMSVNKITPAMMMDELIQTFLN